MHPTHRTQPVSSLFPLLDIFRELAATLQRISPHMVSRDSLSVYYLIISKLGNNFDLPLFVLCIEIKTITELI